MLRAIFQRVQSVVHQGLKTIGTVISHWTKPLSDAPILGVVSLLHVES